MISYRKITLEELAKNGKNHKWDKFHCDKCERPMWGHGFVGRYFSLLSEIVFLKRYRCPKCSVVVTIRPEGYWPYIRSSIVLIFNNLSFRIKECCWPPGFPRQRGGHWLGRLVSKAKMWGESNLFLFLRRCFEKELHFFA
jgi:hypothetical protein